MAEEHEHDPTLDPITCARLDRLEQAIFTGTVTPVVAPDMTARLKEFDRRVEERLQQVRVELDDTRISVLEQKMSEMQASMSALATGIKQVLKGEGGE